MEVSDNGASQAGRLHVKCAGELLALLRVKLGRRAIRSGYGYDGDVEAELTQAPDLAQNVSMVNGRVLVTRYAS